LVEASINSEGGKTQISSGIQTIITAVGFLGDIFRGLEAVWLGLKIAFSAMGEFILLGLQSLDQALTDTMNKIPLVSAEYNQTLAAMAEGQTAETARLIAELEALVLTPLPSENIDAFFNNIETRATAAANAVVVAKGKIIDASGDLGDQLNKDGKKDGKKHIELSKGLTAGLIDSYTPAAIAGAYKFGTGTGGPWLGALYAGIAKLFMNRLASSSAGGGGGGGGVSPGAVQTPVQDLQETTAPRPLDVSITVDGTGKLDRDQAESIAQSIADLIKDGYQPT